MIDEDAMREAWQRSIPPRFRYRRGARWFTAAEPRPAPVQPVQDGFEHFLEYMAARCGTGPTAALRGSELLSRMPNVLADFGKRTVMQLPKWFGPRIGVRYGDYRLCRVFERSGKWARYYVERCSVFELAQGGQCV